MMKFIFCIVLQSLFSSAAFAQVIVSEQGGERNCPSPCKSIAVIFVHGLTGSDATWVNEETGESFPNLLFSDPDPDLSGKTNVYTVQYDTFWNSGKSIVEVTKAFSDQIDRLLIDKKYPIIVFVAHSLGGNIAREYLAHVKSRYGHAALSRFRMVITLGTPTQGASLANFASLFSGNDQIRSLIDIRKNDFLQLLNQTESDVLHKRLDNRCAQIEFDAAYETKPVGPLIIVSKESATANATRTAGEGWNKNHLQLPKPANRADEVYKWVRDELKLCSRQQVRCRDATNPSAICSTGDF